MNQLRFVLSLIFFAICSPSLATSADRPVTTANAPEVVRAQFGIFKQASSGKTEFVATNVVPFVPNQSYGWVMVLRTSQQKVKWREEFTLPVKPDTWGEPEALGKRAVSEDGRTSVTEREVSPNRGLILNAWSIAPGDPKGHYVIRVYVEGVLAGVFEFDVQ